LEECARSGKKECAGNGCCRSVPCHLLPGSAFETDFGGGYDLVLVPNFLHHFDPPTCTTFMRKVHAALQPGGRAAIAELVRNPDRVTPPTAAAFSMMMLVTPAEEGFTLFSTSAHRTARAASLSLH
jgi:2-polyprenyl-3-methyl-5-hydroxy-6-metoxy-1,4-benzoquinol methylase